MSKTITCINCDSSFNRANRYIGNYCPDCRIEPTVVGSSDTDQTASESSEQ
jgi:predicted  nucleic acid-binding Zn-ribbon protein